MSGKSCHHFSMGSVAGPAVENGTSELWPPYKAPGERSFPKFQQLSPAEWTFPETMR